MSLATEMTTATSPRSTTRSFQALSYAFGVETALPDVAALVSDLLHDLQAEPGPSAHRYELRGESHERPYAAYVDGQLTRRVGTPLALVDELLWHVNREAIMTPDPRIAIHASAAVWQGRGMLFPAPANSGKTTLVTALLSRGAVYVTDEAASLDPSSSRIHPYPKPMWMAPAGVRAVAGLQSRLRPEYRSLSRVRAYVTPRALGTTAAEGPVDIDLIVFPTYREGGHSRLEPIGRAEAVVSLARNAFDLARFGRDGVLALSALVERARCYRLELGDLDGAVAALATVGREAAQT